MRISIVLLLSLAVVAWGYDLPTIIPNSGISDEARALWNQIDFSNKIQFDANIGWTNFVKAHGDDHLNAGIETIFREGYIAQSTADELRTKFQRFLSAPPGEHSVPEAPERFLLKVLVNAYDLSKA